MSLTHSVEHITICTAVKLSPIQLVEEMLIVSKVLLFTINEMWNANAWGLVVIFSLKD